MHSLQFPCQTRKANSILLINKAPALTQASFLSFNGYLDERLLRLHKKQEVINGDSIGAGRDVELLDQLDDIEAGIVRSQQLHQYDSDLSVDKYQIDKLPRISITQPVLPHTENIYGNENELTCFPVMNSRNCTAVVEFLRMKLMEQKNKLML
ncbi:unnamed protein product [Litomosoides sigmodontis]|uniref:Uncharacterized protein n=1 Tax=Litomosoides sigmodontis TaxID=42156 RepID=A0A3P7K371_LITSI|nr:unnamed protein product [Litomosoides sigmodontis]